MFMIATLRGERYERIPDTPLFDDFDRAQEFAHQYMIISAGTVLPGPDRVRVQQASADGYRMTAGGLGRGG